MTSAPNAGAERRRPRDHLNVSTDEVIADLTDLRSSSLLDQIGWNRTSNNSSRAMKWLLCWDR